MKATPITQKCKSPLRLDETTLAAGAQGYSKFEDSAAGKVAKAGKVVGDSFEKLAKAAQ
jgi:hypothetical protein